MLEIIIPYRNRKEHLDYFIKNSVPKFKNINFLVIEQIEGKPFNRGKLLNCGFHFSESNYLITHDIDINPLESVIELYYREKSIMGILNSPAGRRGTLGGITKISKEDVFDINGFPNDFWGWGCEDKAFQNRAEFFQKSISKNFTTKDDLTNKFKIFKDNHTREQINLGQKTNFEYNVFDTLINDQKRQHIMKSGLNNLEYNIIEEVSISDRIRKIKVEI